jgi:hypothetical protein
MSFDDLLKSQSDLPVFRLPDGTATKSLNQTFRAFMRDVGQCAPFKGQRGIE